MSIVGPNPIPPSNAPVPVQDDTDIDWEARNEAARARWITEHGAEELCPNCSASPVSDHPHNACLLNVLIEMIREGREELDEYDEYATLERHRKCNPDALWDSIRDVYDDLSTGQYDEGE